MNMTYVNEADFFSLGYHMTRLIHALHRESCLSPSCCLFPPNKTDLITKRGQSQLNLDGCHGHGRSCMPKQNHHSQKSRTFALSNCSKSSISGTVSRSSTCTASVCKAIPLTPLPAQNIYDDTCAWRVPRHFSRRGPYQCQVMNRGLCPVIPLRLMASNTWRVPPPSWDAGGWTFIAAIPAIQSWNN